MSTATLLRPREPVVDETEPLPRLLPAAAVALLALVPVVVAGLLASGAALREARLLDVVARAGPGSLSAERVAAAEQIVGRATWLAASCYLTAGVLFAVWLRTAWRTAYALRVRDLRYGPGWALVGWIVPLWNLWVPKRIVDDLWSGGTADIRYDGKSRLVLVWWITFVVGAAAARVAPAETGGDFRFLSFLLLLDVVLAFLGAAVLLAVTRRLMGRADRAGRPLRGRAWLPRTAVPLGPGAALAAAAAAVALAGAFAGVRGTAELPTDLAAAVADVADVAEPAAGGDAPAPAAERLPVAVEGEGFTIAMPGPPVREEAPATAESVATVSHAYERGAGDAYRLYVVTSAQLETGDFAPDEELDPEATLTSVLESIAAEADGFGGPATTGTLQGRPWRQALVTTEVGNLMVRVLLDGDRLLQVTAGPQRLDEQDVFTPFVETLRFTG